MITLRDLVARTPSAEAAGSRSPERMSPSVLCGRLSSAMVGSRVTVLHQGHRQAHGSSG